MKESTQNIPIIRFPKYTGPWEQRKFVDAFDGLQNNTLSRAELNYESGTIKNVHYGDVLIKFGEYIDVSKTELPYISDNTKAVRFKSSFLQDGDIVIADTAEDDTVGKCTEIQGSEGIQLLSGLHTIACRPKEKYGPKFLGYYINSPAYHNQLKPLMQGIKVTSISKSALQDTDIMVPNSIEEQTRIGEYLSRIDSLITLQQRKLDQIKEYKKGLLQKIFPKIGSNDPEVRFPGFIGSWEQRKLSDEFSDFIVPMRDKPKEFGGDIPWTRIEDIEGKYLNGTLSGQYVTEETIQKMNLKIIPKDSLIVSSSATFGIVAVVTQNLITNQTFIGLVPKDKDTLDFWYSFFQSDSARKYMKLQSAGSTIFYISRESFENMPVNIPSKAEMIRIGKFLTNIDNTITLHQRKLEQMKEYKRGLLQQMFV